MSGSSRLPIVALLGSVLAVGLVLVGVWVIAGGDDGSPRSPAWSAHCS